MDHFVGNGRNQASVIRNIASIAVKNTSYRKVVLTENVQVVLYALADGETLPMETHSSAVQVLNVAEGVAKVTIAKQKTNVVAGDVIFIYPGTPHRVAHSRKDGRWLKMWSVYTRSEFVNGREDKRQPTPRAGAPVALLGAGFADGMTINKTIDGDGSVCIAHRGVPVCHHTHTDLDTISEWISNDGTDVVCPACASEIGATIPAALRLPKMKNKKKHQSRKRPTDKWALLHVQQTSAGPSAKVFVTKEDPDKHPWAYAETRTEAKYAIQAGVSLPIRGMEGPPLKKPRQGVHLLLQQYDRHTFDASKVPGDFPIYITASTLGGREINDDPLSVRTVNTIQEGASKTSGGGWLAFVVPPTTGVQVLHYQCTRYRSMGGPISVYRMGTLPTFIPETNTLVLQDTARGSFTVMQKGVDDHLEGLSFDEMLDATGMTLRQSFRGCATIVPREEAVGEPPGSTPKDDEPTVFAHTDGTPMCSHVYTAGHVQERLASYPDHPCIKCFVVRK